MKFKLVVKEFFDSFRMIKEDKENRKKWEFDIQREIQNPASKFNIYKLKIDEDFNTLSCLIDIDENIQREAPDITKYKAISTEVRPINMYLGGDLNWGEYLEEPEYFYIEPEDADGTISCTYLVTWKYSPVLDKNNKKFWKQFATFCGINAALLGGIIGGLILIF